MPRAAGTDHWVGLREGEAAALGALFDRYSRQVYNFAFRRTASWAVAEEVAQATFVSLWRRRRSLVPAVTMGAHSTTQDVDKVTTIEDRALDASGAPLPIRAR